MIKWFQVPCKFIQVDWDDIERGDEIWIETRTSILGPFFVEERGSFRNMGGRLFHWDDFYPPTTLFMRLA